MKRRPLVPLRLALSAALVVSALLAGSARAALTVNTTTDSIAPGGCEGAAGDCSLRQAIAKASAGETVNVPSGTYALSLGFLGISQALTVQGAGARTTSVIRASGLSSNVFDVHSPNPVVISGLTISAGHVTGTDFLHGGAVFNETGSVLTLDADTISGTTLEQTAPGSGAVRGAGIANRGTLSLTNSTVSGNVQRATGLGYTNQGAGLFNSGGTVSIVNSSIVGNSQVATSEASSSGAGIVNLGDTIELQNATVAANTGSAAIYSIATINAKNTIVSNGASGNCTSPITSQGHNLESADECGFHSAGDQTGKDPLLGALADNGGPTDTAGLLAGSPAIDTGDPAGCPLSDQRGVTRPQGSACDIGAFELVPLSAIPSNAFKFGRLKRNKRKGTATMIVIVPGAGTITLKGKGVVGKQPGRSAKATASKAVSAAGRVKLLIKAKGKAKRKLGRTGKVKVKMNVTYTPTGGTPNTKAKTVKLIKRP